MNWFFASGDAPFFFTENLQHLSFLPDLWHQERGLGQSALPSLWIDYPFYLVTWVLSRIGLSWFWIDKIWWFTVFLLAMYGSYKLAKRTGIRGIFIWISLLLYVTNTYFLMLFDGGQLGVALAYGLVPLIIDQAIEYTSRRATGITTIRFSLLVGVSSFWDIRITYVTAVLIGIVMIVRSVVKKVHFSWWWLTLPLLVGLINSFWLIPTLTYSRTINSVIQETSASSSLAFFSVADWTHAISLLHPNYPDNMFGRVYFFKPEFLILPILTFSLFVYGPITSITLSMGFVAIVGAFLGKGVQDPLGIVYHWLYDTLPGFFLFRDPTKWYLMVAIAYTILLPYQLQAIKQYLIKKLNLGARSSLIVVCTLFLGLWCYSLRFVINGQVSGNSTPPKITTEYIQLSQVLIADLVPSRSLWLPQAHRFGFQSDIHPALSAQDIFSESSPSGIQRLLQDESTWNLLDGVGVGYIIVPDDIEQRIFIEDYQYQNTLRESLINHLDTVSKLQRLPQFTSLGVYRITRTPSFFWLNNMPIVAQSGSNDRWLVSLPQRTSSQKLHVAMTYDPNWVLTVDNINVVPEQSMTGMMQFTLPSGSAGIAEFTYSGIPTVLYGALISGITILACVLGLCLYSRFKRKS